MKTRILNAVAPIRICDLGGWTDTWFAKRGVILNMGVYPYVQCQMTVSPAAESEGRLTIHAENYGDRYTINPQEVVYARHPLLEACIEIMRIPRGRDIEVTLYSSVPAGSSTGTSAAVTVALIGALDMLTPGRMTPHEVAAKAHEVETVLLHQQSGIQDQLCSAFGGINFIDMHEYPFSAVSPIYIPNSTWWELESRISLVFVGHTHHSSKVHESVIDELRSAGETGGAKLEALRQCAAAGRDALFAGDFAAFGRAMIANTDAQANLHPSLVSPIALRIIDVARRHGALGWKVNGAGGEGGSLTILSAPSRTRQRNMLREITELGGGVRVIDTYLSRYGLRVWEGL
ncbi:MAG: GHMP kinase [Kiritimatiellia bacterium]|jgi:D-glycero-alpha-D-manno-heptose-7-phosphate kinase